MSNSQTLRVAAAQYPITAFKDFETWRAHTGVWVARGAVAGAKLLVFPEYGAMELLSLFGTEIQSDLRQNLEALQPLVQRFCSVFADLAHKSDCIIVAPSLPVAVSDTFVNRAYVFGHQGLAGYQDKFFMTRFEDEEWGVSPGEKVLTLFEAEWGSFGVQICYDIEFGVGSHHLCAAGAELIAVPSCTETIRGATRVHVGARARALENQCYTLVAQTVGDARWSPVVDVNYGFAACYSAPDAGLPEQGIVTLGTPQLAHWHHAELDLSAIAKVRADGQVFNFRDSQRVVNELRDGRVSLTRVRI